MACQMGQYMDAWLGDVEMMWWGWEKCSGILVTWIDKVGLGIITHHLRTPQPPCTTLAPTHAWCSLSVIPDPNPAPASRSMLALHDTAANILTLSILSNNF